MKYSSEDMEKKAITNTASRMCAAIRTAPKARGIDNVITLVLTGSEKDALADKMDEDGEGEFNRTEIFFPVMPKIFVLQNL